MAVLMVWGEVLVATAVVTVRYRLTKEEFLQRCVSGHFVVDLLASTLSMTVVSR